MTDCEDAFDRLLSSSNSKNSTNSAQMTNSRNQATDSESDCEIARPAHSKNAILDDSSDEDGPVIFKKKLFDFSVDNNKEAESDNVNTQSDEDIGTNKKSKKRIRKVIVDSDDESIANSPLRSRIPPRVDSDDDDKVHPSKIPDGGSHDGADSDTSVQSNRSSRSSKSERVQSNSPSPSRGEESEGETSIDAIKSKIINKHRTQNYSKLLNEIDVQDPEKKRRSKPKKEKAPSRKAKDAAIAEIHSETQRMIREKQISLPYHKPKQRSLADFLNRRKLAPAVQLKTTSDELAKVWKHAEEREKTAEHFYRSESDEETENKDCSKIQSAISTEETQVPQKGPDDAKCNETTADILQGQLNPTSVSQPPESEEFPRLELSEIIAEPDGTDEVRSVENTAILEESCVSFKINTSDLAVDSAEKYVEDVTADPADGAPINDTVLIDNAEKLESNALEDSSIFSQSSLCEKINSLNLPIPSCPKISGAADEVIDLDELSTKPGAFGLMQRFIKHSKLKSKPAKQQNVLSVMTSEVNDRGEIINFSEETIKLNKKVEPKPGERLVVLKTTLQQKMAESRGQQLAKKYEEYKLYEDEFYGVTGLAEDEEEIFSEEECSGKEKKDDEKAKDEEVDNPFLDYEADESAEEDCADDDEDKDDGNGDDQVDEDKGDDEETASVLLGGDSDKESDVGEDDSDTNPVSENEDVDEIEPIPPIPAALHSLAGTQNSEPIGESQLMALCSGDFTSSAINLKVLETSSEALQNVEDEDSCAEPEPPSKLDGLDSDDEEILSSKKHKNKKRKLSFSDDEDSTNDNREVDDEAMKLSLSDDVATEQNQDEASDDENQEDDFVEEDENDEEVQLAKKLSKGFLDKEAELSESEWGSEDEDEKGLDQYEEEEGDHDKINQRSLQKELGKIHMREVLADDNREIRILQELLLEDGDLHSDGPKRQRLFRWYNQDEDNAAEKRPLALGENGNENEEEDEELWRRQRLERENYLRKKKIDNLELEIVDSPVNVNDTKKGVRVTPKITPTAKKSPDPKSNFSIFSKRGSFLGRGEKMLTKLAEITNNAGSKENALGNSRNNRNMVFSVVSPPKEKLNEELMSDAPLKRKGDFIATSIVKKIKFSRNTATTNVSALDQLKLFEST